MQSTHAALSVPPPVAKTRTPPTLQYALLYEVPLYAIWSV